MDAIKFYLLEKKNLVDRRLKEVFSERDQDKLKKLDQTIRYSLFSGGKRIRPILTMAIYEIKKKDIENILLAACCVEIFHTASLMLDDLPSMDNAKTRRNNPSPHIVFGESTTILAAVSLASKGFEILSKELNRLGAQPSLMSTIIEMSAKLIGMDGTIGGQFMDLNYNHPSEEEILLIHTKKTGSLFYLSALLGAELSNFPIDERNSIIEYAKHFGLLYQIVDDLNDTEEDKKINMIKICGAEKTKQILKEEKETCIKELEGIKGDTTILKEMVEYIYSRGEKWISKRFKT